MAELDTMGLVRLLINQVTGAAGGDFTDDEVSGFLTLESQSVKRAAAQAIDVVASNEALVSKVIVDRHLQTNGAATAKALRDHANTLRQQALFDEDNGDGFYFGVVELEPHWVPENTGYPIVEWPVY